jgi:hypothetical protein
MDNQEQKERRQCERYPFREDVVIDGTRQAYSLNICEDGFCNALEKQASFLNCCALIYAL